MKNTFAICTISACLIAPISGAVGFIAGTHHYANADLQTKIEIHRISRAVDPLLSLNPFVTPYRSAR
jgi:hypothetical protein